MQQTNNHKTVMQGKIYKLVHNSSFLHLLSLHRAQMAQNWLRELHNCDQIVASEEMIGVRRSSKVNLQIITV